jgi:hypothetical protein
MGCVWRIDGVTIIPLADEVIYENLRGVLSVPVKTTVPLFNLKTAVGSRSGRF